MINRFQIQQDIQRNAERCRQLHARVHETFKMYRSNIEREPEWKAAVSEFRQNYYALAFPDGYGGAINRILAGDAYTIEAALCFVECRPFFFRSGYMIKAILPKLKRADLSDDQRKRLDAVLTSRREWRVKRREERAR